MPGLGFTQCYARRVEVKIGSLAVPFISLDDLKTNKKASGRPKDMRDFEELP